SSNWKPGAPAWKRETSGRETRKPTNAATLAQMRMRSLLFAGMKSRTASPASGVRRMMLSKCWSIELPRYVVSEEGDDADHDEESIGLHASGLQDADGVG